MGKVERFEDLEVWSEARMLARDVYALTSSDRWRTDYKFRDQIRSSAGSVMDNIAEGFERGGNKEFLQFLYIAKGSCGETRSQLYRALDFEYITNEQLLVLLEKTETISKRISALITYLKNSEYKGEKNH